MISPEIVKKLSKNNYVRKASYKRKYWFDFSKGRLDEFEKRQVQFNIVIYSGFDNPDKYYIIPFEVVSDAFKTEYMTKDKLNRKRWVGTIENNMFKLSNYSRAIDISKFYSTLTPEKITFIKNWENIVDNFREFSLIHAKHESFALNNFSQFSNWYYFPVDNLFAPGKFIGYLNNSIDKYNGAGDGAVAKNKLDKYFTAVKKDSEHYCQLLQQLKVFASMLGKNINMKIINGGSSIFYPLQKYASIIPSYSNAIFNAVNLDIDSYNHENHTGFEGNKNKRLVSYYERLPKLRARAIQYHGTKCQICCFDFKLRYGIHGEDYIEVHHKKALHTLIKASEINPETDMAVLCANCHRMVHRKKYEPLSIEELKIIWDRFNRVKLS